MVNVVTPVAIHSDIITIGDPMGIPKVEIAEATNNKAPGLSQTKSRSKK